MRGFAAVSLAGFLLLAAPGGAGEAPGEALASEHWNATRTVHFRTPASWTVQTTPGEPEVTEARGDGLILRVLRREGELGLDSLHVECMLVRLRGPMDTFPQVDYEYDFVSGGVEGKRALDSAFVVHYDDPVDGHRDWRQRNLTVVGDGESVCVVAYAPARVWKKSKRARKLLTDIVESARF